MSAGVGSSGAPVDEPILGWRIWRIAGSHLQAVVWGVIWEPQARFEARCEERPSSFWPSLGAPEPHQAPGRSCDCGVYAFTCREDAELLAREKVDGDVIALGRVSLWGRVIEAERGFRGQYAYPYDVTLLGGSAQLARRIRSEYAIDVDHAPAVTPLHHGSG
ncbi:MAG: hypothetical protein FJW96_02930 [Actinobacteria bacterium]|nr:hypothetical protein [Actinomycetota bacterium]